MMHGREECDSPVLGENNIKRKGITELFVFVHNIKTPLKREGWECRRK
jgi:hypothetical protein